MKKLLCLMVTVLFIASCTDKKISDGAELFTIEESILIDSVPADFPVAFGSVTHQDKQIIAYYNKNRNLTVASRKTSDSSWKYKVLPTKVGWDSHNRITITLDRNNCIHVTGNMHNDSLTYFVSEKPLDVLSLYRVFPQVSVEDELSCTYPSFIRAPEGKVVFTYRKGGSGNGINITNVYDEESKTFSRLTDKPLFDGIGEMSSYFSGPRLGPDGWYHVIWVWRDSPRCETNHDLSYARSKDLIHWENIGSQISELPITPRENRFTVDPVPPGGGVINGAFRLFFDKKNKPYIVYMKYDEVGNNQLFVAQTKEDTWTTTQISNWKYRWEFSGPGSIDFHIRIRGASVTNDEKIQINYWHKERGDGQLIVDLNTMDLLEDQETSPVATADYPEKLLKPFSNLEDMEVHWMKIRSKIDAQDSYYLARWETLGTRRFYEPPEIPVPPSSLHLYKIVKN